MLLVKLIACIFAFSNLKALDIEIDQLRNRSRFAIQETLKKHSVSLEQWIQDTNQSSIDLLCLGESHSKKFRDFYGSLLNKLQFDHLFLEAQPEESKELVSRSLNDEKTVNHEGANIAPLLRLAHEAKPKLKVTGIEQTQEQSFEELKETLAKGRQGKTLTRESFIAFNAIKAMKKGHRHIALYGAHHCAKRDRRLPYSQPFIRMISDRQSQLKVKSVLVYFRSQERDFVRALLGFNHFEKSFVIPDTSKIKSHHVNYRTQMVHALNDFDVIIYINDNPQDLESL